MDNKSVDMKFLVFIIIGGLILFFGFANEAERFGRLGGIDRYDNVRKANELAAKEYKLLGTPPGVEMKLRWSSKAGSDEPDSNVEYSVNVGDLKIVEYYQDSFLKNGWEYKGTRTHDERHIHQFIYCYEKGKNLKGEIILSNFDAYGGYEKEQAIYVKIRAKRVLDNKDW